jgi:hypothetical protein
MGEAIMQWDRAKLARFKTALEIERPYGRDHVFSFDGADFLVAYAEYLVEYLEGQFRPDNGERK